MSGQINSFNFETRERESAEFDEQHQSLPGSWDALRLGMSISLTDGSGFGQGNATQSLTLSDDSIRFSGLADVNVDGYAAYPYMLEGSGSAMVNIDYHFRVASVQEVELFMDSTIGEFRDDDYKFCLTNATDGIVWGATGIEENGVGSRTFKKRITLQPGVYTIAASLRAGSFLSGEFSAAGRTRAEFAITAVPEAPAGLMLGTGLCILGLGRLGARQAQQRQSLRS